MNKCYLAYLILLLFTLTISCSNETNTSNTDLQTSLTITVENTSTTNLQLSASVNLIHRPDFIENRFFVFKSGTIHADSLNAKFLLSLTNYSKTLNTSVLLSEATLDFDSDVLSEFVPYQLITLIVLSDSIQSILSNLSENITPVKSTSINGYWTGFGSTNLFPSFNEVLDLSLSDNHIVGRIYYGPAIPPTTQNYHTFRATIDGIKLTEISLTNNPTCTGSFHGEGNINSGSISMNTPGTDCDGVHTFFNSSISKQ